MISIFETSVIPYIVLSSEGEFLSEYPGSFFSYDDDNFMFHKNEDFYRNISLPGWYVMPKGYASYAISFDNLLIIFTGMKVKGVSKIQGKNIGIPYLFQDKKQIENYVENLLTVKRKVDSEKSNIFREYSHETKEILRDIYQKALEIKTKNSFDPYYNELFENIFAFTGMLSTKTDIMNFLNDFNLSFSVPENDFGVHKKFSKIMKCLNMKAKLKGIDIVSEGTSYKSISGPRGFELIPFLLIENAIKYSPENNTININFEDYDDKIQIKIESMGPLIEEHEKTKIFTKNYRGRFASLVEKSGQGIGLYIVKEFLGRGFNGTISVSQNSKNPVNLNKTRYMQTIFELNIPIKNEW